ncbi:hypothetical protein GRX01_13420 [Halobaculum sp. WSA2]|uniref:Uncharacterized protein n=1 Tax=Halobaculum saliterrae TaxID=2073113 RepID=A0A6B0T0P1_9EURY|nr:hypothetical protein [Halobaculum saliterrae]MXR42333.1 hypothetical protein [Halobaculum saliterrae]
MVGFNRRTASKISMISTGIDAAMAFARGRRTEGLVLLGAAALSSRVPGIGTAVSILSRVLRRLR